MKVFVTGSAGFLGSWVVDELLRRGDTVVSVDSMIGGDFDNVPIHPNHRFIEGDILHLDLLNEAMKGCDVVVHTAALAYEGLSVFSPGLILENILVGTTRVATAAVNNGVKRIVNCSSMSRYGDNPVPFTEVQDPNPVDPYAIGKVSAEKQLLLMSKTFGIEVVNAVPHNIIGPRQKFDDPYRNVASIMINRMLQGKQPIVYGDGHQRRCFSFVEDVLDVLIKLVDVDLEFQGECFNVGPDEKDGCFVSINCLAKMIASLMDFDLQIERYPDRPCEVRDAACSSEKIRKRFGYCTKTSLEEGLTKMIEAIKKSGGPREFKYHLPLEIMNDLTPVTWKSKKI